MNIKNKTINAIQHKWCNDSSRSISWDAMLKSNNDGHVGPKFGEEPRQIVEEKL